MLIRKLSIRQNWKNFWNPISIHHICKEVTKKLKNSNMFCSHFLVSHRFWDTATLFVVFCWMKVLTAGNYLFQKWMIGFCIGLYRDILSQIRSTNTKNFAYKYIYNIHEWYVYIFHIYNMCVYFIYIICIYISYI